MTGAAAIEACAAWPEGRHPILAVPRADGSAQVCEMRALPAVNRRTQPALFPAGMFDPVGSVERGEPARCHGIAAECIAGRLFIRAWLDAVRVAFPGVRWRVDYPACLTEYDGAALFGCVDGRVVAIIAESRPQDGA